MTTYGPQSTDPHAPPWARSGSHRAGALDVLAAAVNAHWPKRDHTSDGYLGDARHVAEGSASDHNPWLAHTVRAADFDVDGVDAPWLAEALRLAGAAGDHRLTGGGYVIFSGHITTPDFSAWTPYTGGDEHTTHLHVSLTRDLAGFEDRGPWVFLSPVAPQPPHPAPAPADVPRTGHDLAGHGDHLTGHLGDAGPRVTELEQELAQKFPAYAGDLAADGVYGRDDAAALAEFAHREAREADTPAADRAGLAASDGLDIGPRSARAFRRDGIDLI